MNANSPEAASLIKNDKNVVVPACGEARRSEVRQQATRPAGRRPQLHPRRVTPPAKDRFSPRSQALDGKQQSNAGFLLIESIVIVVIISMLTSLLMVALPAVRHNQRLNDDSQKIQALLRDAQQRAVNEVRPPPCLERAGADQEQQRRCSNVGIALKEKSAVLFSDSDGDRLYTPQTDYLIEQYSLSASAAATGEWRAFVFEAAPPTVMLFANNTIVTAVAPATIQLQSANYVRQWTILPFGLMEEGSST